MIGATALLDGSPYFSVLMVLGVSAIVIGMGGLVIMLLTAGPTTITVQSGPMIDQTPPPDGIDDKAKALWLLRRARENSVRARKGWGSAHAQTAYHEIRAAMIGIKSAFGVAGPLRVTSSEGASFKDLLEAYIAYADTLYPLLEGGHLDAARKAADSFKWSSGWD